MESPIIIVEYGQQRQRLKLNKYHFNINELLELFSRTFKKSFNLNQYEIFLLNQRIDDCRINIDFSQLDNYQRFKIEFKKQNEINSLKQRLTKAETEITKVDFLIKSIHKNCQNLIKIITNENPDNRDLAVPPGFTPLTQTDRKNVNTSPGDSQSTDEGIDRDSGSLSVFESAHSDYQSESIYAECKEDLTIINQPYRIVNNENNQPYRIVNSENNQPYRPRNSQWNSNNVKYPSYDTSRKKKPINPNKPPLAPEKKKNIPCKYAAGGNCKRGSQCRFIHVV